MNISKKLDEKERIQQEIITEIGKLLAPFQKQMEEAKTPDDISGVYQNAYKKLESIDIRLHSTQQWAKFTGLFVDLHDEIVGECLTH